MFPLIEFGTRQLSMYGICMALGLLLASFLAVRSANKDNIHFGDMVVLIVVTFAACLVGAKVLFIFVTYPIDVIWLIIKNGDWDLLLGGGLVFYGGLIFGVIAALITLRLLKIKLGAIEKHVVPYIPLGHGIGRIGCLLAGCCFGMEYNGFGAVQYNHCIVPPEYGGPVPGMNYFPVQALETLADLVIMVILLIYSKKQRRGGDIVSLYLILYAIMRFCTEMLRGDVVRGVSMGISTSQWISIGLIAVCIARVGFLAIKNKLEKQKNN